MGLRILRKPWQFRRVYGSGRKVDCQYAVLFYFKGGKPSEPVSFGFVASRRVGGAVDRNRAKRRLRAVAREIVGGLKRDGLWVVLVARGAVLTANYRDLRNRVQQTLIDEGLM